MFDLILAIVINFKSPEYFLIASSSQYIAVVKITSPQRRERSLWILFFFLVYFSILSEKATRKPASITNQTTTLSLLSLCCLSTSDDLMGPGIERDGALNRIQSWLTWRIKEGKLSRGLSLAPHQHHRVYTYTHTQPRYIPMDRLVYICIYVYIYTHQREMERECIHTRVYSGGGYNILQSSCLRRARVKTKGALSAICGLSEKQKIYIYTRRIRVPSANEHPSFESLSDLFLYRLFKCGRS